MLEGLEEETVVVSGNEVTLTFLYSIEAEQKQW